MPPKKQLPQPIDRPLSRAYLREFTGWSSAYPPGISDPTSLRVMENVMVNRDGSARIRPGLRYMSLEDNAGVLGPISKEVVGTHEPFFLNDGTKAYLFAVREADTTVGFRVLTELAGERQVKTLASVGFTLTGSINFSSATTYVKYLQIDNKIFALSNAGETMRLFTVGDTKTAKALASIERPAWSVSDKLTVIHPDAGWVNNTTPVSTRTNLHPRPNGESVTGWGLGADTLATVSSTLAHAGANSLRLESKPTRTNLHLRPTDPAAPGGVILSGWAASANADAVAVVTGDRIRVTENTSLAAGTDFFVTNSVRVAVTAGESYRITFDLVATSANITANGTLRYRWEDTAGNLISTTDAAISATVGRKSGSNRVAPAGATHLQVYIGYPGTNTSTKWFELNKLMVTEAADASNTFFSGASGADYYWDTNVNQSASYYHPPRDLAAAYIIDPVSVSAYIGSSYVRSSGTGRNVTIDLEWLNAANTVLGTSSSAPAADSSAAWTRFSRTDSAVTGTTKARYRVNIAAVPRGEYHYVDSTLFELGSTLLGYFDGTTTDTATLKYAWTGTASASTSTEKLYSAGSSIPAAETKTANTLMDSTAADNTYNFGFFYTFSNEVGESAASQVTVVRTQRSWAAWRWETPNAAGEPSGTSTNDPEAACDQLVAYMPQAVHDAALDQGAIAWNLYAFTWSDQDPVPVVAMRIATRDLTGITSYGANGWLRMTPQMADAGDELAPLPRVNNLRNYSDPSRGGQGIVAADRMVMVNDPTAQAVIRWTSNQQGNYTDFSASRGGGYKTLTSGNLYVPACVKLWQNPQSVDTLTILCMGVDGMSTGYYMAPSQVASQSEATNIMGFEETTATPGTTSPYGVEVHNNALYHPLDEMLMKSTANNYNISHKSITEQISNLWTRLGTKHRIVSSQHDNRLYYLVNNPQGEPLEDNCWGNEVWVFDAQSEGGSWSRWLTQGKSLRRIEQGGRIVMSLVRPDGIFYFDPDYAMDDVVEGGVLVQHNIAWKLETNTQGANRAHDAWANLQQCNITVGFFQGVMRYGIRGYDVHGQRVEIAKLTRDGAPVTDLAYDLEDFLLVRRNMKEWFFFAESAVIDDVLQPSAGQINLVQYRYTPASVNAGYENGSIETFEYGRAGNALDARTTDNGVPIPFVDTGRP